MLEITMVGKIQYKPDYYKNYSPQFIEHLISDILKPYGWKYSEEQAMWYNPEKTISFPVTTDGIMNIILDVRNSIIYLDLPLMAVNDWKKYFALKYRNNYIKMDNIFYIVKMLNGRVTKYLMDDVVIGSIGEEFPVLAFIPFNGGPEIIMFIIAPIMGKPKPDHEIFELEGFELRPPEEVPEAPPPEVLELPPPEAPPEFPPMPPPIEKIALEEAIEQIKSQPDINSLMKAYLKYNPLPQFKVDDKRAITNAFKERKRELAGLPSKPIIGVPPSKPAFVPPPEYTLLRTAELQIRAIMKAHHKWEKSKEDILKQTHDLYGTPMDVLEKAWELYREKIGYAEQSW